MGLLTVGVAAQATAPARGPSFEVASIKPNNSSDLGGQFGVRPDGQLIVRNNSLRNIIRNAYQLQNYQMVGGPPWLDNDRFDITAKTPGGQEVSFPAMAAMVQALLAERFKLVVHRETRELPIYALVLARPGSKPGPQVHVTTMDCSVLDAARRGGGPPPVFPAGSRGFCGTRTTPGRLTASAILMSDLARNLSNAAGRMTVDKTGLTDRFDLDLEWTPDQLPPEGTLPPGVPRAPVDGPSLFTAVQEQLGLKLDSQRGPVDVLVIDSAERPTPD
jgi:uncharacterized protein (TIGR03435 family)